MRFIALKPLFAGRLRLIGAGAMALALFAGVATAGPGASPAYALTNCDVADYSLDSEELAFLQLINNYRVANGLGTLTASVNLDRSSTWMSVDMATKNYFSHTDSSNRSSYQRMKDCGVSTQGWTGENIAAGYTTAQAVFDAWKASPGHNENMLSGNYKQIGISRYYVANSQYRWYWTTDFSGTPDGTNAGGGGGGTNPTATPTRTPVNSQPTATATKVPPTPTSVPNSSGKAVMTTPAPGSTLSGTQVTFRWNGVSGAREYWLYFGTQGAGSNNLANGSVGLGTGATVSGLPRGGQTIYVRLWTRNSANVWVYNDYTYKAAP